MTAADIAREEVITSNINQQMDWKNIEEQSCTKLMIRFRNVNIFYGI